ncbi:MAG: hypothetical protein M3Y41_19125, partial [Pseudomonadota bacterium]|nr:hypothetical protein [Pseudomonadota bacterium]
MDPLFHLGISTSRRRLAANSFNGVSMAASSSCVKLSVLFRRSRWFNRFATAITSTRPGACVSNFETKACSVCGQHVGVGYQQVFASADTANPQRLSQEGLAGPVQVFARALVQTALSDRLCWRLNWLRVG